MKLALQYLNGADGRPNAVRLSVNDWEKVLAKLKNYEQILKIKSDLAEAFEELAVLQKSKEKKQSLVDFLDEL